MKRSDSPWAGDLDPLELKLDLAGLDVSEAETYVLDQLAVGPHDGALFGEAVVPTRLDLCHYRPAREALQTHPQGLQERPDLELRVSHLVVHRECVVVEHRLYHTEKKSIYVSAQFDYNY